MAAIWIDDEYWICPRHMRAVRLPASADSCWYAKCPTQRPARPVVSESEDAAVVFDPQGLLARHHTRIERGERSLHMSADLDVSAEASAQNAEAGSEPGTPAEAQGEGQVESSSDSGASACEWSECGNVARDGSKYCSRKCSNKNARARYLKRQRNKPEPTEKKVAGSDSGDRSAA